MRKIYFFIILAGLGFFIINFFLFSEEIFVNSDSGLSSLISETRLQELRKTENSSIVIYAVGDIMLDRGVEYMIQTEGKGDFRFPFLKMAEDLRKADILFGNLEGPMAESGIRVGSIYSFRSDPRAVEGLKYAGFDMLSLANNHMLDYGRPALEDTIKNLKNNQIDYVGAGLSGAEAFSMKIKEIKNVKIGFLAYTDLGFQSWRAEEDETGMAWINEGDIDEIKRNIEEQKKKVDILIVSLHSGDEYQADPSAFQEKFARTCIDAGADVILGHHPHVVQRTEQYKKSWVIYSLGNFVFDQFFSPETMKGALLEIIIINGKIEEVNAKEVVISQFYQPCLLK